MIESNRLGATWLGEGHCTFRVWAPHAERVDVRLLEPREYLEPLNPEGDGYFSTTLDGIQAGGRYFYRLNGETDRPDPASRYQPEGVHGPSAVVDPTAHQWADQSWTGHRLDDYVIYELHVGTFSEAGTFDGVIPHLDDLADLGITMIEIMPVAQFPGSRNWGYDGVGLYAVQASYGGPEGLRRMVDACHQRGIGVILDVVYNHLGPEGNYLREFGPYFTDHYATPWGEALNLDGGSSDHVRRFFLENGRYWLTEYHIDAFRLDAVHAIYDQSATHFLEAYRDVIHAEGERAGRNVAVIAESDLNDPMVIREQTLGGYGFDAQWTDDFHHSVHALLTGERDGYYQDYGSAREVADALQRGYVFIGQYSAYRGRTHGRVPGISDARRFVVCTQNHDQVGNRAIGDRLTASLEFSQLKLAAGVTILSPFTPLIFMGEEYAEPNPFQYFVSHGDPDLVRAVQEGRRREFEAFNWQGDVPDPQADATFEHSRLNQGLSERSPHREMRAWYRELLRLRRTTPALARQDLARLETGVVPGTSVLWMIRYHPDGDCLVVINFAAQPEQVSLPIAKRNWTCLMNSQDTPWDGPGSDAPSVNDVQGDIGLSLEGRTMLVYLGTPGTAP